MTVTSDSPCILTAALAMLLPATLVARQRYMPAFSAVIAFRVSLLIVVVSSILLVEMAEEERVSRTQNTQPRPCPKSKYTFPDPLTNTSVPQTNLLCYPYPLEHCPSSRAHLAWVWRGSCTPTPRYLPLWLAGLGWRRLWGVLDRVYPLQCYSLCSRAEGEGHVTVHLFEHSRFQKAVKLQNGYSGVL